MISDNDQIEASALQDELETIQTSISKDVVASEEHLEVYEEVESAIADQDQLLQQDDISDADTKLAQESFYFILGRSGLNKKEMSYFNISSESELTNRQKVLITREGLGDVLKAIFYKIMEILKSIWNKLKEWWVKFVNWCTRKTSTLKEYKSWCQDNKSKTFAGFKPSNQEKIIPWFSTILDINKGGLDISMLCEYIAMNTGNPFNKHIAEVYQLCNLTVLNQDTVAQTHKVIEKIKNTANTSVLHRKLLDHIQREYKDINVAYVYSAKKDKIKYYAGLSAQAETGFAIGKFTHEHKSNVSSVILNRVNKYGDLISIIDDLIKLSDNSNKYFDDVLDLNDKAFELVKELKVKIEKSNNNITSQHKDIIRRNLSFIKSLGTDLAFAATDQYTWYVSKLTSVIGLAVEQER